MAKQTLPVMKARLEELIGEMLTSGILYQDALAEFEKRFILLTLTCCGGNISTAADELRLNQRSLSEKVSGYWLESPVEVDAAIHAKAGAS